MRYINLLKRIIVVTLIMALCTVTMAGCGKRDGEAGDNIQNRPDTVANNLYVEFADIINSDTDINSVAEKLTQSKELDDMSMVTMPIEPGFLNGFNEEVNGFNTGVIFAPMIGTIPFVGYIFETDDADGLIQELKAKAQLNWNICTTADEMVVEKHNNYVFFVMAPEKIE